MSNIFEYREATRRIMHPASAYSQMVKYVIAARKYDRRVQRVIMILTLDCVDLAIAENPHDAFEGWMESLRSWSIGGEIDPFRLVEIRVAANKLALQHISTGLGSTASAIRYASYIDPDLHASAMAIQAVLRATRRHGDVAKVVSEGGIDANGRL